VGECGLDYYYLEREIVDGKVTDAEKEKERQKNLFIQQIEFAKKNNLPLMLHGRPSKGSQDAYIDMLSILNNYKGVVGNVHFFVGDTEIARQFLELGFTFSFGGVTTITSDYDDMIRSIPTENIHLETDSPYVAPKQYRGQRNSPEYLLIILKRISEIKSISEDELVKILNQNAERVFGIKA
jgi:TatD DNase family protein